MNWAQLPCTMSGHSIPGLLVYDPDASFPPLSHVESVVSPLSPHCPDFTSFDPNLPTLLHLPKSSFSRKQRSGDFLSLVSIVPMCNVISGKQSNLDFCRSVRKNSASFFFFFFFYLKRLIHSPP